MKNEEGYILKGFLRAFKENFKQSTIIWAIVFIVGSILALDLRIVEKTELDAGLRVVLQTVLRILSLIFAGTVMYLFPMAARYRNTVKEIIKNSLILSVFKFPYTVLLLVITIGPVAATFLHPRTLMIGFVFWPLLGVSAIAWVNSYLLRRVFMVFDEK